MGKVINQRGAAILPILLVVSVVLILLSAFIHTRVRNFSSEVTERRRLSLNIVKAAMETQLANNEVWQETIRNNSDLACLATGTCPTLESRPLTIFSLDGRALSGGNSYGFTDQAVPCDSLDPSCALKYQFTWRPMCTSLAACTNPMIEVVGELKYGGSDRFFGLILSKYQIVTYRQM